MEEFEAGSNSKKIPKHLTEGWFSSSCEPHSKHVQKWEKTEHDSEHTIPTVTHCVGSIMLQAAAGKMGGAKYDDLTRKPVALAKDLTLGQTSLFLPDNGPKQRATATMEWIKAKHIPVLEWSSQSPGNKSN